MLAAFLYSGAYGLLWPASLSSHDLAPVTHKTPTAIHGWFDERTASNQRLMYVADAGTAVDILTLDGKKAGEVDGFTNAQAVAVGPAGRFFVLDDSTRVYEFKKGRTQPFLIVIPPSPYAGVLTDLTVGVDGSLYVAAGYSSAQNLGGVITYARGATIPSRVWQPDDVVLNRVSSDRKGNLYATYQPYEPSASPGVIESSKGRLGYTMVEPESLAIAHNGDIVVCDAHYAEIETFAPGKHTPYTSFKASCNDFSLGPKDTSIYVPSGRSVFQFAYPSGELQATIGGFRGASGIAIEGVVTD